MDNMAILVLKTSSYDKTRFINNNFFYELHPNKHTAQGNRFVDFSHGGGEGVCWLNGGASMLCAN